MKYKLRIAIATGVLIAGLSTSTAFAWTYGLTGSGTCQKDGSFLITWKIDNTAENEDLNITDSSNPTVVPVGTKVPAGQTEDITQTVDGKQAGSFDLTLKGNFLSDEEERTRTATADLEEPCTQPTPTPPPTGGSGGGTTVTEVKTTPVGPVNAGAGSKEISPVAIAGLTGSLLAVGFGVHKLRKSTK